MGGRTFPIGQALMQVSQYGYVNVTLICLAPKGARKRKYLQLDLHALACRLAAEF